MKVVLDSNIIIAAFAGRGLCSEIFEICIYEHQIVLCDEILDEISRNLRKKIKVPQSKIDKLIQYLQTETKIVHPDVLPKTSCRDADDLMILGTATKAKADAIVTGDNDLLVLKKFQGIVIVSPRGFWEFIRK